MLTSSVVLFLSRMPSPGPAKQLKDQHSYLAGEQQWCAGLKTCNITAVSMACINSTQGRCVAGQTASSLPTKACGRSLQGARL